MTERTIYDKSSNTNVYCENNNNNNNNNNNDDDDNNNDEDDDGNDNVTIFNRIYSPQELAMLLTGDVKLMISRS